MSNGHDFLNFTPLTDLFNSSECEMIIKLLSGEWEEGITVGTAVSGETNNVRKVQISTKDVPEFITTKILNKINEANDMFYNFKLGGLSLYDPPRMFKYEASEHAHYGWHNDFGPGPLSSRKLSFSLQLSAPDTFEGGELEFSPGNGESCQLKQGTLVIFPAYLTHRITEVTSGTRYCIVGWVHGPFFS